MHDKHEKRFFPVEVRAQSGHQDCIEELELAHDDQIVVLWPNGQQTEERVLLDESTYNTFENGKPVRIRTTKAFVEQTSPRGAKCLVRLHGSGAVCYWVK